MLEFGRNYTFNLFRRWEHSEYYRISGLVVGSIAYDRIGEMSNFDLRGELFTPQEISLSDYLRIVSGKEVYMIHPIKTWKPIDHEDDPIFIPAGLIDGSTVDELLICDHMQFNIGEITRWYPNMYEMREGRKLLIKEVRDSIGRSIEFVGEDTTPEVISEPGLVRLSNIKSDEEVRREARDHVVEGLRTIRMEKEEQQRIFDREMSLIETRKRALDDLGQEITEKEDNAVNLLNDANRINNTLGRVEETLRLVREQLINIDPDIPSFDDMYNDAYQELYGN